MSYFYAIPSKPQRYILSSGSSLKIKNLKKGSHILWQLKLAF